MTMTPVLTPLAATIPQPDRRSTRNKTPRVERTPATNPQRSTRKQNLWGNANASAETDATNSAPKASEAIERPALGSPSDFQAPSVDSFIQLNNSKENENEKFNEDEGDEGGANMDEGGADIFAVVPSYFPSGEGSVDNEGDEGGISASTETATAAALAPEPVAVNVSIETAAPAPDRPAAQALTLEPVTYNGSIANRTE
jgi:hypothetical protein